jgi:hypothetical protein
MRYLRLMFPLVSSPPRLWGGQSFESADAVPTGQVEYEYIDGPLFNVSATEGVLVCL